MSGFRRGACPGLATPLPAGDGLIARLRPFGPIEIARWEGLCAAARQYGNGIVEVTARGSLQFRGLSQRTSEPFAATVAALKIPAADRPAITTSPLAGCAAGWLIDAQSLAAELAAACAHLALHPKFSIAIDDGSALHLDALAADLRLRAIGSQHDLRLHLAVGGSADTAAPLGAVAARDAVLAAARILAVAGQHRLGDLRDSMVETLREIVGPILKTAALPPARSAAQPLGRFAAAERRVALGVAPAFGHATADVLVELGRAAGEAGALGIRPAPGRALLLVGVDPRCGDGLTASASALGFITESADPRRRVVACPGAPSCSQGEAPARALAPTAANVLAGFLAEADTIHISGCGKRCAHPRDATLTLVGEAGNYRLLIGGHADDAGCATIPVGSAAAAIGQIAALAEPARGPGTRFAEVLSRLGPQSIATAACSAVDV